MLSSPYLPDKNLGPVILDRTAYIRRAHTINHLCNSSTYKQLTKTEVAAACISTIEGLLSRFLDNFRKLTGSTSSAQPKLMTLTPISTLQRKLTQLPGPDPFPYFYFTAKAHKTPWSTRPVVSVCASLLHHLGCCWVDQHIKTICRQLPSYVKSSFEFRQELLTLPDSLDLSSSRIYL